MKEVALAEVVVEAVLLVPAGTAVAGVGLEEAGAAEGFELGRRLALVADEILPRVGREAAIGVVVDAAVGGVDEQIQ
jgi:hypothetical protein